MTRVHHDTRGVYRKVETGSAFATFFSLVGSKNSALNGTPWHFTDYATFKSAFSDIQTDATINNSTGAFTANVICPSCTLPQVTNIDLDLQSNVYDAETTENQQPKDFRLLVSAEGSPTTEVGATFTADPYAPVGGYILCDH